MNHSSSSRLTWALAILLPTIVLLSTLIVLYVPLDATQKVNPTLSLHNISNAKWAEARAARVEKVWTMAERLSPSMATHVDRFGVYGLFPETYQCNRTMFRKLGAGNVANGGDGGKWSCTEFFQPAPRSCVVVSLGSRGEFDFENSILEYTNNDCTIYTFDCTGTWISPNPNIKLYSWCLGNDEIIEGRIYKTWHSITKELGLTHVDYFKIDIEGYEWVAMPTVLENWELGVLPKQIAIEIHLWSPQPEGVAEPYQIPLTTTGVDFLHPTINLFRKFYEAGYHVAATEYNHQSGPPGCCQEFTFVRVDT